MDDWYAQDMVENRYPSSFGTSLNPLFEKMNREDQFITSLDDNWDSDGTSQ